MPPNYSHIEKRQRELFGKRYKPRVKRWTSPGGVKKRRTYQNQGAGRRAKSTYIRHGGGKVSSATRARHKAWTGAGTGTEFSDPGTAANSVFKSIYNNLTSELNRQAQSQPIQDFNTQVADENAVRREYAATVLDQQVNPVNPREPYVDPKEIAKFKEKWPNLSDEDIMNFLKPGPSLKESMLGEPIWKYALEPLSRAAATIPTGVYRGMEAGFNAADEGANPLETLGETLSAVPGGFVEPLRRKPGEPIIGGGEIYEIGKERSPLGRPLRALEDKAPWAEQALSWGAGLGLDFVMDPIGSRVGGVKSGVIDGQTATRASAREYARRMAEKWAADVEDNVVTGMAKAKGNYRYVPDEAALADQLETQLVGLIERSENVVSAGASRGRYEILNPNMTAHNAGIHGGQVIQKALTFEFSNRTQRLVDSASGRGPHLNGTALEAWEQLSPDFTELLDDLTADLAQRNRIPPNASRQTLADNLSLGDEATIRKMEQAVVDRKYSQYIQDATNEITRQFRNDYYNTPGIRVGKKVFAVKGVGRAYSNLNNRVIGGAADTARYGKMFPGSLGLDTTRARAWGVKGMEDWTGKLRAQSRHYSKEEAEHLTWAIENNKPVSSRLQPIKDWIVGQYKEMYELELEAGARGRHRGGNQDPIDPYFETYTHVATRGKSVTKRGNFKYLRKKEIHDNHRRGNGQGAGRFKTENAAEQGLNPRTSAFEALQQRRIKHNRDMTRAVFRSDMIDKYGISSKLNPAGQGYAAAKRSISEVDFAKLPERMRTTIENTGENIYLPQVMQDMLDNFDEITKWNGAAQGQAVRGMTKIMNLLKRLQTLPWLGFHNKNIIGDVFMSLLDNVNADDYTRVFNAWLKKKRGKEHYFKMTPDGHTKSFTELWDQYEQQANSGFINAELGDMSANAKNLNLLKYDTPIPNPKRAIGAVEKKFQDWSGYREDAGRFTHYVTAYQQEAKALWKKGERDWAKIDKMAGNAALWRVNNYKFDYNALALWEKKTKTLAFPFYTFIRKAAPTLVQALYQDPRWLVQWYNFLYEHSIGGQPGAGGFDMFRVPEDIREMGTAILPGEGDEKEPWTVSNELLPTSVFNAIGTDNPHDFFNSLMSQMQMPAQIGVEQGTSQNIFQDRPLGDESFADYMLNKLPGTREVKDILNPDKTWTEKLIGSRMLGGLPIKPLRENQQLFAEQEWQDRMIDDPLDAINKAQDLYYVSTQYPTPGVSIFAVKNNNIKDASGDAIVEATFNTVEEAVNYVQQSIPGGYEKKRTTWDVDNQGNPYKREVSD